MLPFHMPSSSRFTDFQWETLLLPTLCSRLPNLHLKLKYFFRTVDLYTNLPPGSLSLDICLISQTIMSKTELHLHLLYLSFKQCIHSLSSKWYYNLHRFLNWKLEIRYICNLSSSPVWFTFKILSKSTYFFLFSPSPPSPLPWDKATPF